MSHPNLKPPTWTWKHHHLDFSWPLIMGILNVTPDSFSDGNHYFSVDRAVERAWQMQHEGADVLDVGAESSRPGAEVVNEKEELARLIPVLDKLKAQNFPLPISLDSYKAPVLKRLWEEGLIDIHNDISGLRDPENAEFVKRHRIPVIIMHMFGTPQTMQKEFSYQNVVQDLLTFFHDRLRDVDNDHLVMIDPGIGFGKSVEQNLDLLRNIDVFSQLGKPILVGASRKSFLGTLLGLEVDKRLAGSLAVVSALATKNVAMFRVHDVAQTHQTLKIIRHLTCPMGVDSKDQTAEKSASSKLTA
ncbi:MAG: dihydropteroate synthase [Bdellovibrionota bacterium]